MTPLELVAVVFSLASVVLAARRHVGTWPTGIVGVAAYFVVFVGARLYADAALQLVFVGQSVYGWVHWSRRSAAGTDCGPVVTFGAQQRALVLLAVAGGALLVGAALARHTNASSPYLDATVSVMSLTANWLLARRVLENWALWVTADVLYVGLFLSKGLMLSAALYVVFLGLAAAGWREWWRARRAQLAAAPSVGGALPQGAA